SRARKSGTQSLPLTNARSPMLRANLARPDSSLFQKKGPFRRKGCPMPEFTILMCAVAAMLAGGAAASGWTSSVIVANTAFDGLDHGRADRMLRNELVATPGFRRI